MEKSDEHIKVVINDSSKEHYGGITDLKDRKCFIQISYDSKSIINVGMFYVFIKMNKIINL